MILFLHFVWISLIIPSLITLHVNETYLDVLNEGNGSFQKPFNKMKDIFLLKTDELLQIQIHSNISCNEKFSNIGSKNFM